MRIVKIFMILIASVSTLYKYRMKVMNLLVSIPFLRKIGVRLSMRIPYFRNKLMKQMFSR
ncbi:hypothetical protein ACFOZ1_12060 [Gracilibacillus marinus]|uniref:Uncharacterized protein n=1 Tax=Gracilibacillus marinus TaxID=630535 RepID=A0ABV8VVN0_9BACI